MGPHPLRPGQGTDRLGLRPRQDRPTRHVVRVLESDQTGACQVVDRGADGTTHRLGGQRAVVAGQRTRQDTREDSHGAHLVVEDVTALLEDHLLPGPCPDIDRDLVPHRSGRNEQGRLLAHVRGGDLLETANRRVFAEHVVTDLRLGHGPPHGGRRPGDGVGAKIDAGRCPGTAAGAHEAILHDANRARRYNPGG